MHNVVVTGVGVVSSIGIGKEEFWKNLLAGKSGIGPVTQFDTSTHKRHNAGEIKDFDPLKFIRSRNIKFYGRASQMAIVATKLALHDAGITQAQLKEENTAVIIGATMPEGSTIDHSSERLIKKEDNQLTITHLLNNFAPSLCRNIGMFFKIKGDNLLIPCACAAGNYCIGYGFDLIQNGKADIAIVGGAEALSRIAFQGFQRIYAMAQEVCTPFDKNRKGMMLGEGAAILILESYAHARKRNAEIYAYVSGYGLSCDAFHMTIPKRTGMEKAMEKALQNAGVKPEEIDYVSAHGTGTGQNDKEESAAINDLFGKRKVPVSSIKSMLGHTLGAAAAIEAIACCLAIKYGKIPPTINHKTSDPDCDVDCVPNLARTSVIKNALNNSFAFGGNNSCVVFSQ